MSKAYDRLEWPFLEEMLLVLGFDPHWVNLIMAYVTTVTYKIKFNGTVGTSFAPHRGIRQGDPISPYLFILAAEGLTALINDAVQHNTMSGAQLSRNGPTLSHLMFADDTMIVSKANEANAYEVKRILHSYSMASGQCINVTKSEVLFSKAVANRDRQRISSILEMPIPSSPIKYLGLPGNWQGSRTQALTWLKDRIWQRIQGWKEHFLSPAGKEVLIKAVIQAIPSYVMSVFIIPKAFCDRISGMIARFWWRSAGKERGLHWVSWAHLKKPKKEGGLGFRDLHAMNMALIAKQVWRIHENPNSLWVWVLKGIYFPNSSIWDAKKGANCSWGWTSILKGRDFINRHKAWLIKDGADVNIATDRWLVTGERILGNDIIQQDTRVAELMTSHAWNVRKVFHLFPRDMARSILATPINPQILHDDVFWPHARDGKYSVKTGYKIALQDFGESRSTANSSTQRNSSIWNIIWGAKVQPKIKSFMWRLLSNAIPTQLALSKRGLGCNCMCPVCGKANESIEHIFTQCEWTQAVWFGSPLQWHTPPPDSLNFRDWFDSRVTFIKKEREDDFDNLLALFFNILWGIWIGRNKFVFEGKPVNPLFTINNARELSTEFANANYRNVNQFSQLGNSNQRNLQQVWSPPPANSIKLNVDGAFDEARSIGACAVVVRDENGILLTGSTKKFPYCSPMFAEALAVREAFLVADSLGVSEAYLESDCAEVVRCCHGASPPPPPRGKFNL